jgi:8-oxo-(d)GTP phosphatase
VNLPPATLLLRHAWAGERGTVPDDRTRPLDDRGRRQADALLAHLDVALHARGLRALAGDPSGVVLVSSPLVRCAATLAPMAEELGVAVSLDDRLAELPVPLASRDGWPDAAYLGTRALAALADAAERSPADGALVLCAHGEVLPALVAALAGRGRLSSPVSVDLTAKRLPKGASWLLVPEDGGGDPLGGRRVEELGPPA